MDACHLLLNSTFTFQQPLLLPGIQTTNAFITDITERLCSDQWYTENDVVGSMYAPTPKKLQQML